MSDVSTSCFSVCSYIQYTSYVFRAVPYIQTSVCTLHAWMHKVHVFTVVAGMYEGGCVQRRCRERRGEETSVHCSCLLEWVWTGRGGVWGCTWGLWRVEAVGHWSAGFLVVLEVSGPEPEWQHTLLWVNILTSGEPHPLPAEHWPTNGAVGRNRQRKQKHVQIRHLQRLIWWTRVEQQAS